jgi:hypothetical protein
MWGGMAGLVLQLIAGAVGGSVIGTTIKRYDLGIIGNVLAGIVGGGIGAQIIGALVGGGEASAIVGPDGFDFGTLAAQFAAGALAVVLWSWLPASPKRTWAARSPPEGDSAAFGARQRRSPLYVRGFITASRRHAPDQPGLKSPILTR